MQVSVQADVKIKLDVGNADKINLSREGRQQFCVSFVIYFVNATSDNRLAMNLKHSIFLLQLVRLGEHSQAVQDLSHATLGKRSDLFFKLRLIYGVDLRDNNDALL